MFWRGDLTYDVDVMGKRLIAAVMMAAAVGAGCRARPKTVVEVPKPSELLKKPAIDLSHGVAAFPLATTTQPTTAKAMAAALHDGYAKRLESPEKISIDAKPGLLVGEYKRIWIDISGSQVRADFSPKAPPKESEAIGYVTANTLRYTADPLKYQHFSAGMRLDVRKARLGIMPAGDGTFGMALYDCEDAHANLTLSMAGMRDTFAKGVESKNSMAFMIDGVELSLASENPRSLSADVIVSARLLLIPAKFRLTGRLDIDDAFNVHFSNLNATGLDPTGKVVAGVVQSKLDKMNNKAAPLLKMPGDRIKISEFQMKLGEMLTIDVDLVGGE